MRISPPCHWICAALLLAFTLTSCTADSGSGTDSGGGSDSVEGSTTPAASLPSPADGTDYDACDDGTCEVSVTAPFDFTIGDYTLAITEMTDEAIEMEMSNGAGSRTSGSLTSRHIAIVTANSAGVQFYGEPAGERPEPELAPGDLALELLGSTEGAAIIRLTLGQ